MSASITCYIVHIIYIALAWILYPLHFIACFLRPKIPKHFSSKLGKDAVLTCENLISSEVRN
jgi:hypothetical protein